MKKSTKLILLIVGLAVLALILGLGGYLLYKSKTKPKPVEKPKVTYRVSPNLQSSSKIEEYLLTKIEGYDVSKSDAKSADIIITEVKSSEATSIGKKQVGQPIPLKDAQFVISRDSAIAYATFQGAAQNFSQPQKDQIAQMVTAYQPSPVQWTLNAVGDIIIGRTVYEQELRRADFTSSFTKVADLLKSADITLANNESTLADGIPYPLAGLSFAAPARAIDGFVFGGIDAVNLANNHSFNGGPAAFSQMIDNFHKRGIKTFGGGKNTAEAHTPATLEVKGIKLGLLGYDSIPGAGILSETTPGQPFISMPPWGPVNEAQVVQMEADIKATKASHDVVIVYFHWSQEYTHQASEQMRTLAHRAVDAGADLIIGTHPHWVQGIEWYNGHLITYSLGNFIFDQEQMLKTKQGVMLSTTFEGTNLVEAKFTPVQIENYFQPHVLEGPAAQGVLNDIYSHSWWVP